jgi:hypothetical protein
MISPQTMTPKMETTAQPDSLPRFDAYKAHTLGRLEEAAIGRVPFHHLFVEQIFADDLYTAIRQKAYYYKHHAQLLPRLQDNKAFTNDRYNLVGNDDLETRYVRALFSDNDIKHAMLKKFYLRADRTFGQMLSIHDEFEYVYTAKDRFQNVHVDVPAKFLSLVFYFPERESSEEEQRLNATILYDKELKPHYPARYKENSVCVFAPHFHSYHGFATTIDRTALVMFYVDRAVIEKHQQIIREAKAAKRLDAFMDTIQSKLATYPLLEYGASPGRLVSERRQCRINAPRGRVMRDGDH